MTAQDYIHRLKKRQPDIFAARKILIKVKSLEEQLRLAFEAGHREATVSEKPPFFDSLFGSRPPGF